MKKGQFLGFVAIVFILGVAGCEQSEYTVKTQTIWDFEDAPSETLPQGWFAAQSGGKTPVAKWQASGDSWGRTLAIIQSPNTGQTHNLLLSGRTRAANVSLSVKLRSTDGQESRGGGIIWRVLDPDNYYVVAWDATDNTLRLGCVEKGKYILLQTVTVYADPTSWHVLAVEHFRNDIKVFLDDVFLIELSDHTLLYPGMIGLVTQADACTMFDDVTFKEIR